MTKHVFISYCTPDLAVAKQVCADLENDGLLCWMAPRDVPQGGDHASVIPAAIGGCPAFVLLLSKAAMASKDVRREVHLADGANAAILPVRLESLEPIDPNHPFLYLLTGVQYIDATSRIQPQLGRLRERIREILAERKVPFVRTKRSRFNEWLATFGAWSLVVVFDLLMLEWLHRTSYNLTSFGQALALASKSPAGWAMLAPAPLAALAGQIWLQRDWKHIASLDALFAVKGNNGARRRLVAAVAALVVPIAGISLAPAVTLHLVKTPLEPSSNYERLRDSDCPAANQGYILQTATYYRADLRIGRGNPEDAYTFELEMAPYASKDGLEFCDVWLDKAFGDAKLVYDEPKSSATVQARGPLGSFAGRRAVLFTLKYYEGNSPSPTVTIRPRLSRDSVQREDREKVALPLH